jgi:RecA/RadA recombinase
MAAAKKVVAIPRRRVTAQEVSNGRVRVEYAAEPPKSRRAKIVDDDGSSGQASTYFTNVEERTDLKFVSSGCAVLNAALGGGWVLGRVANIVGDRSAGKTLLAIEACANFHHQYPEGKIRYNEAEAAFDEAYAEALGMPAGVVDFKGRPLDPADEAKYAELLIEFKDKEKSAREHEAIEKAMRKLENKGVGKAQNTVEALYDDLVYTLDQNKGKPILYIIDSLDALSDEAEQGREIGDASYGGTKPKKMGELFRRLVDRMETQGMLFIVISQLRDKLNVTFGEKQTRTGGRALDFYASHIVWLAEIGKIKKTIAKIDRVVGVDVRARVKKNKVGLPFRECDYPILFGYGVDDLTACAEWLISVGCEKCLDEVGLSKAGYKISLPNIRNKGGAEARDMRAKLSAVVWREWQRIESGFLPKSRKY